MTASAPWPVAANAAAVPVPVYKQRAAPIERRVRDLLGRMTVEEKARQLDMYAGADIVDKIDNTHASPGAHVDTLKIQKALGAAGWGAFTTCIRTPRFPMRSSAG